MESLSTMEQVERGVSKGCDVEAKWDEFGVIAVAYNLCAEVVVVPSV